MDHLGSYLFNDSTLMSFPGYADTASSLFHRTVYTLLRRPKSYCRQGSAGTFRTSWLLTLLRSKDGRDRLQVGMNPKYNLASALSGATVA